jgi:porin
MPRLNYLLLLLILFANYSGNYSSATAEVLTVSQLSDVKSTDWAFQALQSLTERYQCIAPNPIFRGEAILTRYEFAAGIQSCTNKLGEILNSGLQDKVSQEDLSVLKRLQSEFATELTAIAQKIDPLEQRTDRLEVQQFSPTTKLTGQAIFALSTGRFSGDRIISPTGATITNTQPNTTVLYRLSLDFNSSFKGNDLLKIKLVTGSDGANDSVAGFLEPNFGSVLEYSIQGRNNQFSLARLYYSFNAVDDLRVTVAPRMVASDFVDKNRFASTSFIDFSTQSLANNFVLLPRPSGAGAVIEWMPKNSPLQLRALYVAANAESPTSSPVANSSLVDSTQLPILIFPTTGGDRGLFGDPYQGVLELEYAPSKDFSLRLQYAGGKVVGSPFSAYGINFDWAMSDRFGVFGRYGYSGYNNTAFGNIQPQYWMFGLAFPDLFMQGAKAGVAIGQPLVVEQIGNATQTNFEAFYNIPVSKNLRITPIVQVIANPANQSSNGAIVTGTLRTVFSF